MTDEKLLPCPFCGEKAKAHIWECDDASKYAGVECTSCAAEVAFGVFWMDDGAKELTEAIAAWNRRTDAPKLLALAGGPL